jgi:hypothetical protein
MNKIYKSIALLNNRDITGSQTFFIDEALANTRSEQMSAEDAPNVINYIDAQLLYNEVSKDVRDGLSRLYNELLLCRGKA